MKRYLLSLLILITIPVFASETLYRLVIKYSDLNPAKKKFVLNFVENSGTKTRKPMNQMPSILVNRYKFNNIGKQLSICMGMNEADYIFIETNFSNYFINVSTYYYQYMASDLWEVKISS